MVKQALVPISDLQYLIWKCPHCPAEIMIALCSKPPEPSHSLLLFCPSCEKPLNSTIKTKINEFRRAYQHLVDVVDSVTAFRLKSDEPTTKHEEVSAEV
jgi:hypothetical protein